MRSPKKNKVNRRQAITPEDREFGRKIAALRKAANLTQAKAALIFEVSEAQYGKYERGQTPMLVSFFYRIVKYFNGFLDEAQAWMGLFEEQSPFHTVDATLVAKVVAMRHALEDLGNYVLDQGVKS